MTGVLYVANSHKIGGGDRVFLNLFPRLDPARYRPVLAAPGEGPLADWAREAGVPLHLFPRADGDARLGRAMLVRQAASLAGAIVRSRVEIVHALAPICYRPAGLAGMLTRVRRVCHLGFPPGPGELEWCFRFGPEAVIGCYEGQAREAQETLSRFKPRCRVISVPNGIDTRGFAPGPTPAEAATRFGGRHVVTIVGHLSEVKGYPTFLRAAAMVAKKLEGCIFLAVGDEMIQQGFKEVLARLAGELGIGDRVRFLGWRNDVAEVLRASDVMVLPSLAEGLPLAILEAMACARPVVATPVGGVPDAVVDGETGFLVPPGAEDALAAALLRLLEDPALAGRMGENGRRRVETHFSLERFAAGVMDVYDALGPATSRR